MSWYGNWKPYVPVARRRQEAEAFAKRVAKKEKRELCPVKVTTREIAKSFWGKAWCDNLEQYSDFENRLPRGRTYLRNGSVIDLQIERGKVKAIVSGSEVYRVAVGISTLSKPVWKTVKRDCSQSIESLMDLMQGRFDEAVMRRLTHPQDGLFPQPDQIAMSCTCPDSAMLCKHVAAALYAVAARLDSSPELLFTLRAVDHLELVSQAVATENVERVLGINRPDQLAGADLSELFGIEIDAADGGAERGRATKATARRRPAKSPLQGSDISKKSRRSIPAKKKAQSRKAIEKKAASSNSAKSSANKRATKPKRPSKSVSIAQK